MYMGNMLIVLYLYSTSNHNLEEFTAAQAIIVLYLYSTSNHNSGRQGQHLVPHCFIPLFYIKPQPTSQFPVRLPNCFIPLFYIKPQLLRCRCRCRCIVLYLYSTSNHNIPKKRMLVVSIVLYLYSTSNHNSGSLWLAGGRLFYTFILHQTTTGESVVCLRSDCFIPLFYIKPQPAPGVDIEDVNCFIPLFYIKPQLLSVGCCSRCHCFIPLFYIKPQLS